MNEQASAIRYVYVGNDRCRVGPRRDRPPTALTYGRGSPSVLHFDALGLTVNGRQCTRRRTQLTMRYRNDRNKQHRALSHSLVAVNSSFTPRRLLPVCRRRSLGCRASAASSRGRGPGRGMGGSPDAVVQDVQLRKTIETPGSASRRIRSGTAVRSAGG